MKITVYCGSRFGKGDKYIDCARNLGEWIARSGHSLVYGGGKAGLMGTVANTVLENRGQVLGVIPSFLMKKEIAHDGLTEMSVVETMSERKYRMVQEGDVFIALPGGLGTLEELAEVLSWARIGQNDKPCILYNLDGYYNSLKNLIQTMVREEFLDQEAMEEIFFAESLEEMESYIEDFSPPTIRI